MEMMFRQCTVQVHQSGEIMGNSRKGLFIGTNRFGTVSVTILAVLVITAVAYGAVSVKKTEIKFMNNMKTGSVDVMIELYEITEKGEEPIQPGQITGNRKISCIPRVTGLRAESYIRVKADIIMDSDTPKPLILENIYGLKADWIRRGEYFYYKNVIRPMESADIFSGIRVPEDWEENTASSFTLRFTVDAIQAENFSPDFNSAVPWGNIQIQKSKETDDIVYRTATSAVANKMTFNSTSGLESNTTDLFENFGYFMAGNCFSDTLEIENKSERSVRLSFCTDTAMHMQAGNEAEFESGELLEQAQLEICCDKELLYRGSLSTVPLYRYVELSVIEPGESKNFDFRITLPEGSKNEYSVLADQVIWKFKADEDILENEENVRISSARTGDDWDFGPYSALALLAVMVMILMMVLGRRNK